MLGESLKRRQEGKLKIAAIAGGAGWIAFAVMLALFLGLQARHQALVYGVEEYRVEMERKLATASTYAYQMNSALERCEAEGRGGSSLAGTLVDLGLPALLGSMVGLPPAVSNILAEELRR